MKRTLLQRHFQSNSRLSCPPPPLYKYARDARCLFIIRVIVYNLYYCCYAKTSSSAVQKRHSKVYGNPIAPLLLFNISLVTPYLLFFILRRSKLGKQIYLFGLKIKTFLDPFNSLQK